MSDRYADDPELDARLREKCERFRMMRAANPVAPDDYVPTPYAPLAPKGPSAVRSRTKARTERVLGWLAQNPGYHTLGEIQAGVAESRSTTQRALYWLKDNGYVAHIGRKGWATVPGKVPRIGPNGVRAVG